VTLFGEVALCVLDALPSAVLVVDSTGRARYANARAASVFDLEPADIVGKGVGRALGFPELAASTSVTAQHTARVARPDGQTVTIGFAVAPVTCAGESLFAVSFRDISDTVRLTRERDRLLQLAAIAESLPTLLHEIRNPLSAIITTVEVMIEDLGPGRLQDHLHVVLGEARRIALQLEGVGGVGRSLAAPRASVVDQACRDICSLMVGRASSADVHLRWDIPDLPLLPLEPSTLKAVLFNLVTNAIHACRAGDTVRVHIRLVRGGRSLELSVVDTGVGMSGEAYRRCTELFFTTKRHGSGIGLALCRRAVESAGGEMEIQSVPGIGTAVTITLPVERRRIDSEVPPAQEENTRWHREPKN